MYNLLERLDCINDPLAPVIRGMRVSEQGFESIRRWPGWTGELVSNEKLGLLAHHMYFLDITMEQMSKMEQVAFDIGIVDPATCTDWLLCLGMCCGVAAHPSDLAVFDKR